MSEHKIAVIPGDGIGIEVITEAKRIMTHIEETNAGIKFNYIDLPWGSEYYRQTGLMMPDDGLDQIKDSDAILFDQLFKVALVMLKQVLLLADHVLIEFVRSRTNLTDQVKIAGMFDETFSDDLH